MVVPGLLMACERGDPRAVGEPAQGPPPVPAGTTGLLTLSGGELHFRPCEVSEASVLRDGTGRDLSALVEELGYGQGSIHARLVLADGVAVELRIAAPEAPACDLLLPEGQLQARGNEPFWAVTLEGSTARWRTPEEMDGVLYSGGEWTETPGGWRFEAQDAEGELVLEFLEEPCIDDMSGARYPFTTRAHRSGWTVSGCGMEGREAAPQPR